MSDDQRQLWRDRGRELGRRGLPRTSDEPLPIREDLQEWLTTGALKARLSAEATLAAIDQQIRVASLQVMRTRELIGLHDGDRRLTANLPVLRDRLEQFDSNRAVTVDGFADLLEALMSQARALDVAWREGCLERHNTPPAIPATVLHLPDTVTRPFPTI